MFGKQPKSKAELSLPQSRTVRGYDIKRMPIGAYVAAMQGLNTKKITDDLIEALFPGMKIDEVLTSLKTIDTAMLGDLVVRAFVAVPQIAATLLAGLTGIPANNLLDDPAIGLDGLVEIIQAWIEVNNIENFINAARELIKKVMAQAANTGSKD